MDGLCQRGRHSGGGRGRGRRGGGGRSRGHGRGRGNDRGRIFTENFEAPAEQGYTHQDGEVHLDTNDFTSSNANNRHSQRPLQRQRGRGRGRAQDPRADGSERRASGAQADNREASTTKDNKDTNQTLGKTSHSAAVPDFTDANQTLAAIDKNPPIVNSSGHLPQSQYHPLPRHLISSAADPIDYPPSSSPSSYVPATTKPEIPHINSPHTQHDNFNSKYISRSRRRKQQYKMNGTTTENVPPHPRQQKVVPPHLRGRQQKFVPPHLRPQSNGGPSLPSVGVAVQTKEQPKSQGRVSSSPPRRKWVDDPAPSRREEPTERKFHPFATPHKASATASSDAQPTTGSSGAQAEDTAKTSPIPPAEAEARLQDWLKRQRDEKEQKKPGRAGPWGTKDRASRWPKNSEMRARSESTDSNAWGSNWEPKNNEGVKITYGENDENAPDDDFRQLLDWEGNWLPAPVEWEGRKGYRNMDSYKTISEWMIKARAEGTLNVPTGFSKDGFLNPENGAVAPKLWLPKTIESQSPQNFWAAFPHLAPEPVWEEDLGFQPWWLTYQNSEPYLKVVDQPSECRVDPKEQQDPATWGETAAEAIQLKANNEALRKLRNKQKRAEEKKRVEVELRKCRERQALEPDRTLKPEINMYLRPFKAADLAQITEIYNWHRVNSTSPPDGEQVSVNTMRSRFQDIAANNFPTIVAVEKVASKQGRSGQFGLHEKIAGFAYADDYHDKNGMFRYTGEVEVYVRHDCRNKGIGSCLLDRLLGCIDAFYAMREGYEWRCPADDSGIHNRGGGRTMAKLMINLMYVGDELDHFRRVLKWFNSFGFMQWGNIEDVACKFDKFLNLAPLQYSTGTLTNGHLNARCP